MMERRRALTLPFTVDKDNLMENPFRIPMTCLSSESGGFEGQVSWTEFASPKCRRDSTHKNGSVLFDCNHTAKVTLEMARRKPCLILTDILKTELGKFHMERIKQNCTLGSQGQMSGMRRKSGQCREDPQICREKRTNQRETRNDKNKRSPTKCNQNTTSPSSQRSRYRRRLQNAVDEVDKDEEDIEEVIIGKESEEDDKFAEVVDCGLSVSWEPAEDSGGCDEFSTASIKEYHLKRRRKDTESQCNGTSSPKRLRESVLRLNGDGRDGGPAITYICPEESGEDGDLEGLDRSIVQFTVGADDPAEVLDTVITADMKAGDLIASLREGTMSNQDNTTKTSPSEPIVLSSDEEESCDSLQHRSPTIHALVSMEDTVIQTQSSQEAETKLQTTSDTQAMEMTGVGNLPPVPVSCIPSIDYSSLDGIAVSFSTLHCGGYKGKSNGDIMIANENIIIPLKDTSEQMEVTLTFGCKELRRYSVWEQQELEAEELLFNDDEESLPPAVLLFFVSETAAAAVQKDLHKLCVKQDGNMNTDRVSPFILLTLKDHMDGMEGAVLRSLLDLDCLKNLEDKSIITHHADRDTGLDDFQTPALSLDESIELIRKTGWDPHLLSLLGLGSLDLGLDTDQDSIDSDTDKNTTPVIQLEVDSQKETILELEAVTETETGTQVQPEEHEEQELEKSTEKSKEEPTPVYTLCHRRTKGSYSVSLCNPDSSWTKYKHQGLAHRLIQFPPPPLKGGITVTMEDLQCLDNGQFLNDVIIDFYLKYLLHKASAAVSERSHVFSSFFYKQLTRRDNASEGNIKDSCQRQRRHKRVKTWTRHVDIFRKDFLFVPVNQEAHWYLVVICFPGLEEPKVEAWNGSNSETEKSHSGSDESQDQEVAQGSKSPNDNAEMALTPPTLNHNDSVDTESENPQEESAQDPKPSPVSCTERTYQKKTVCKRPCILVMDSLKRSLHERVFKLLRDYLESEWEARRESSRDFGPDQMQSSHCKVPLQDNSSDCGLYLLQYVESFLEDPVVHFDLPLHLERWFPRQQVRRKRDEIRDLVLNLYRGQNLDNNT